MGCSPTRHRSRFLHTEPANNKAGQRGQSRERELLLPSSSGPADTSAFSIYPATVNVSILDITPISKPTNTMLGSDKAYLACNHTCTCTSHGLWSRCEMRIWQHPHPAALPAQTFDRRHTFMPLTSWGSSTSTVASATADGHSAAQYGSAACMSASIYRSSTSPSSWHQPTQGARWRRFKHALFTKWVGVNVDEQQRPQRSIGAHDNQTRISDESRSCCASASHVLVVHTLMPLCTG